MNPGLRPKRTGQAEQKAEQIVIAVERLDEEKRALEAEGLLSNLYKETIAEYIQQKTAQVEALEDKLESIVNSEKTKLQNLESRSPGMLAMPGKKKQWKENCFQAQATLSRLAARLEKVREIKEGSHQANITELARKKMVQENPKFVDLFHFYSMENEQNRILKAVLERKEETLKQQQVQGHKKGAASLSLVIK